MTRITTLYAVTCLFLIGCALAFLPINFAIHEDYNQCELTTEAMRGGVQEFKGEPYNIVVCSITTFADMAAFPDDDFRLRIISMDGELLAERFFDPYFGIGIPLKPLDYKNNHLEYETSDGDGPHKIMMPPDLWERVRARLPRLCRRSEAFGFGNICKAYGQ